VATRGSYTSVEAAGREVRLSNPDAARDETEGLGDASSPPHFPKQKGEPKRVQPARRKR